MSGDVGIGRCEGGEGLFSRAFCWRRKVGLLRGSGPAEGASAGMRITG